MRRPGLSFKIPPDGPRSSRPAPAKACPSKPGSYRRNRPLAENTSQPRRGCPHPWKWPRGKRPPLPLHRCRSTCRKSAWCTHCGGILEGVGGIEQLSGRTVRGHRRLHDIHRHGTFILPFSVLAIAVIPDSSGDENQYQGAARHPKTSFRCSETYSTECSTSTANLSVLSLLRVTLSTKILYE